MPTSVSPGTGEMKRRASQITATVCQIVKNKTKKKPAHLFLTQSLVHKPCVCVAAEPQRGSCPRWWSLAYVLNFFFFYILVCKMKPDSRLGLFSSTILLVAVERRSGWMWLSFPHAAASLFLQKYRKLYLKKLFSLYNRPSSFWHSRD